MTQSASLVLQAELAQYSLVIAVYLGMKAEFDQVAVDGLNLPAGCKLVHCRRDTVTARLDNMLLTCSCGTPTVASLDRAHQNLRLLKERNPEGILLLKVHEPGTKIPGADVRQKIVEMTRDLGDGLLAIATVFEGDGLWISSIRMVTRTVDMVVGGSYDHAIFANVEEGLAWLHRGYGAGWRYDPQQLCLVVEQLRELRNADWVDTLG